jgi:enamine deaminase RidA (YjgF/YER057c/UK114 family)
MRMHWRKQVLLEDEHGHGDSAVVRYGPYLFLSGSDGDRDLHSEQVDPALAGQPEAQVRNSYGRVLKRLEQCGLSEATPVWLQNFVSSQDWLLLRLGLWKEFFGVDLCTGGGAHAEMAGVNMITTVAVAVLPEAEPATVVPRPEGPHRGMWAAQKAYAERVYQPAFSLDGVRPAKTVRAGDFIFTVGAVGLLDPNTNVVAPRLSDDAFDTQVRNALEELRLFLAPAGARLSDMVKLDAPLRVGSHAARFAALTREAMGGSIPAALHALGLATAGANEVDVKGMAVRPGVERTVVWSEFEPDRALVVRAGGLVFTSGASGWVDQRTGRVNPDACGDLVVQADLAFDQLRSALERSGSGLDRLLRLDVFLSDIYRADELSTLARERLGASRPAISIIGGKPAGGAAIELSAIAADS